MKRLGSFNAKRVHAIHINRDLTPDFRPGNHAFRYNSSQVEPSVKPASFQDLVLAIVAFVIGVLTLGLFLSGSNDSILFLLSIFFPITAITALLKR